MSTPSATPPGTPRTSTSLDAKGCHASQSGFHYTSLCDLIYPQDITAGPIKYATLKKAAGGAAIFFGMLPKAIGKGLNLLTFGLVPYGPLSAWNGFVRAGDRLLKDAGTDINTRRHIYNIVNVNIDTYKGSMKFIEQECKDLLCEVAMKNGCSKDEASELADAWMLTVKNNLTFQQKPSKASFQTEEPQNEDDQHSKMTNLYKEWEHNYQQTNKLNKRLYNNKCVNGKRKLDTMLADAYTKDPTVASRFDDLMAKTKSFDLTERDADDCDRINDRLAAALFPPSQFIENADGKFEAPFPSQPEDSI